MTMEKNENVQYLLLNMVIVHCRLSLQECMSKNPNVLNISHLQNEFVAVLTLPPSQPLSSL